AKRLASDVRAVSIVTSPEQRERLSHCWNRVPGITDGVQFVPVEYDYRNILEPLIQYIEKVNQIEFPNQLTTVVVPEFIPEYRIARFMHSRTAERLRNRLTHHPGIVIIQVPYHIRRSPGYTP
ncbi:MAG: hypothetical protein GX552_19215, partial [Chloroflexi bacterium]|nr:hypothetical protein [Chloroflexota bacterium]